MKNIPPEEIVIGEIFPRLPARSVIRLSSARKSWRSHTVRDLPFLSAHRSRWSQAPTLRHSSSSSCFILKSFLHDQMTRINVSGGDHEEEIAIQEEDMEIAVQKEEKSVTHRPPMDMGSLTLVTSCDNLLCLASNRVNYYYIHNLSAKEWVTVSTVCQGYLRSSLRAFYYHPSTGEYRLLTWFKLLPPPPPDDDVAVAATNPVQLLPHRSPCFGVLSLKLGSKWRLLDGQPPPPPPHCSSRLTQGYGMFQPQATVRGNLHWAPVPKCPWILAFDVETEGFRQLDIPRRLSQQPLYIEDYHIMTLGQELVLGYTRCNYELELWLLEDYKYQEDECWVKLHTISIPSIVDALSSGSRVERKYEEEFFQPLSLLCSAPAYGEDLLVLRYNARVFILYNLVSKRIKWVTAKMFCGEFVAVLADTLPCLLYSFN